MRMAHLPFAARPVPVEIAFREVHPSPDLERQLHAHVRRLLRSFPEVSACRVLVEPAAVRGCHLLIDLTLAHGGLALDVPAPQGGRRSLPPLLREAFRRARGQLARRRRPRARTPFHLF